MSLATRLSALVSAIGTDIKALFARAVPAGGTAGQVLAKTSATDFATGWVSAGAGGGTTIQAGSAVLDFGVFPGTCVATAEVAGQTGILDTSVLNVWVAGDDTSTDHDANDHRLFGRLATAFPGVPSQAEAKFSIHAFSEEPFEGTFTVRWSWFNPA